MPHARRVMLVVVIAVAIGPAPACIIVSGPISKPQPSAPETEKFAIYPTRPGETTPVHPTIDVPLFPGSSEAVEMIPGVPGNLNGLAIPASSQNFKPDGAGATEAPVQHKEPNHLNIAGSQSSSDPPLVVALRAYMENRADEAFRTLQALDKPSQDFALSVIPLLVRGMQLSTSAADPAEVALIAEQFQSIASGLEPRAALRVEKVVFCRRANKYEFGRYEPWPEGQPYRPNDIALLYYEIRHIGNEVAQGPNGEGYLSRVTVNIEVRDAHGRLVEQTDPGNFRIRVPVARVDSIDNIRSPLHDWSRTYRMSVPAQPGVYTLTLVAKDAAGNRSARSQPVEFTVAGP